jgi:hypothetical protein
MSKKFAAGLIAAALPLTAAAVPESFTVDPYHSTSRWCISAPP